MNTKDDQGKESLDLIASLPIDLTEQRVDALWRQVMVYKALAGPDLTEAKARRAQAEDAREKAEQETADAARRLWEGLKQEAEKKLNEAEQLKGEAATILRQAEEERSRARDAARQAEESRQRVLAEAKREAQELSDQARLVAQQESTDLRRQALKEIRAIMGHIETMRAATDEELETQRIFSNVTKLKAMAPSRLTEPLLGDRAGLGTVESPAVDLETAHGSQLPAGNGPFPESTISQDKRTGDAGSETEGKAGQPAQRREKKKPSTA